MRRVLCLVCSFLIAVSAFAEFGSQDSANLYNIELMLNANTPYVRSESDNVAYIKNYLQTNNVDYSRFLSSITNTLKWYDRDFGNSPLSSFLFNRYSLANTNRYSYPTYWYYNAVPGDGSGPRRENGKGGYYAYLSNYHEMILQQYPTFFASMNNYLYYILNNEYQITNRLDTIQKISQGATNTLDTIRKISQGGTNTLDTIRKISQGGTNTLDTIQKISQGGTNILHDILTTLQTNKTEISGIGITNLIDYTSILESISRDVSEIPDAIDNGLDELGSTVEQSVGQVYTNQLAIIGGVSSISNDAATIAQTSIASTNIESAIQKRLDGWDYFYKSFTNSYVANIPSSAFYQFDIIDGIEGIQEDLNLIRLGTAKSRPFNQLLRDSLTWYSCQLSSINNYLYTSYRYDLTNSVSHDLKLLYNSFSDYANIYTNSTLSYILNPSSYSRANIYTPMYFYKGTGNNAPVQVQQQTIKPDLEGFSYNINKYIPNTLASVNNYLYDFFNNGVKVSNFPSFNFTNIVNVATTNNVEVEVVSTNNLDKWEVIAGWLETYSSSSASADFLASAVVYDSFSDLSSTNTLELEEISATGDFLQDMYNSQLRINQLLSNINKSLMMQGAGSDQLSEISSAQEEMEAQSETLKSLVDGSDLVPTINSEVENALNLPDLPTVQDTELPEVITLSIPHLVHPNDFYDIEIETDKLASFLSSVRAFFRFVWWSLVALIFWFVLRLVLRMALRLAKFISTLKVY